MRRPSFDPKRVAGPEATPPENSLFRHDPAEARRDKRKPASTPELQQLTVSQVSELIKQTLERLPTPIRVLGEVSNFNQRSHWYFSLKDDGAVLSSVAWATTAKKFNFIPKDGDQVVATGHLSHYGPQGRTQFYVDALQPVGAGALEMRFRQLCDELRGLGYFDEARKAPLPLLPRRIAVITSITSAAAQDVIATAKQRCNAVGLLMVDVRVQGEGSAVEVAHAIDWVDEHAARLGVDAMLVTRGGGSIEDLWAFNERSVADAVMRCRLPLVAAIGHESDVTIIELVADMRASTPTQAVMRLVPSDADLLRQMVHMQHRLGMLISRAVERERRRLNGAMQREVFRDPTRLVRAPAERLGRAFTRLRHSIQLRLAGERVRLQRFVAQLPRLQSGVWLSQRHARLAVMVDRLHRGILVRTQDRPRLKQLDHACAHAMHEYLRRQHARLSGLHLQLTAMDPYGVLQRGYSLTTDSQGRLLRSVQHVRHGQPITTRLSDGTIESTVGRSQGRAPRHVGKPSGAEPDQAGLFDFKGELGQTTDS